MRLGSSPTRHDGRYFALFLAERGGLSQPRRVGGPIRRGSSPTRRGGRFFAIFRTKRGRTALAMSRWKPNTTSLLSNTTWRALFRHFPGKKRVSCRNHGALEAQYDVALLQHDVAGAFSPFSRLKEGIMPQPWPLETQYDMALFQHDMAGVFPPFSELKEGIMPQPRRVGGPMRRGAHPTRRGGRPTHP